MTTVQTLENQLRDARLRVAEIQAKQRALLVDAKVIAAEITKYIGTQWDGEPTGIVAALSKELGHARSAERGEMRCSTGHSVVRTERGWGGHFIRAYGCLFRRNTLLRCGDVQIVISTVGMCADRTRDGKYRMIGCNRYYETMAFHADTADTEYHDADVTRHVHFDSPWAIDTAYSDTAANNMHEAVVSEIASRLSAGEQFPTPNEQESSC